MDGAHNTLEQEENDFAIALELSLQDQAAHTNVSVNSSERTTIFEWTRYSKFAVSKVIG